MMSSIASIGGMRPPRESEKPRFYGQLIYKKLSDGGWYIYVQSCIIDTNEAGRTMRFPTVPIYPVSKDDWSKIKPAVRKTLDPKKSSFISFHMHMAEKKPNYATIRVEPKILSFDESWKFMTPEEKTRVALSGKSTYYPRS